MTSAEARAVEADVIQSFGLAAPRELMEVASVGMSGLTIPDQLEILKPVIDHLVAGLEQRGIDLAIHTNVLPFNWSRFSCTRTGATLATPNHLLAESVTRSP